MDYAKAAQHNSLGVFPEEVWEAVLEQVGCSNDIENVFLAFPLLDKLFHNKKGDWLFGLVLPHLMTKHLSMKMLKELGVDRKWTQSKELMNLRLVSKRWRNFVDRALKHSSWPLADENSQLKEIHFNCVLMLDYHLGMTVFHNAEQVDKFMEDMRDHQGNPFPAKSIWVQPVNALVQNSEPLIEKLVDLFEKFGKHVEVFELEFFDRGSQCHLEICKNILKCLSFAPNLRSLIFKGQFEGQGGNYSRADKNTSKVFENPESQTLFPELPNLESFNWQVLRMAAGKESNWTSRMIKAYAKGENLVKLGIEQDFYWTTVLSSTLTNLTELSLFLNDCSEPNAVKLEKVLMSLPCGQKLRKLGLKSMSPWDAEGKVNLYELINILAGFQIESLVLEDLPLEANLDFLEDDPEMKMCAAATITSIFVEDNLELKYEFLEFLPNLRFITVHQSKRVRQDSCMQFMEGKKVEDTLASKLRQAILKPYNSGVGIADLAVVWEKLPKLEMIRGSVEFFMDVERHEERPGYDLDVQYVRECGNRAFYGWLPDWEPDAEQWIEDGNDDDDDYWF